ncbi:ion transporter [Cognaticolwellia beringensis]|uniref:Ion transporter n=1 Tax=Cognaticolwellia beringensis TaxID=1967665 RepID=A0A222GA76_9GAMM|nr:ion transporter [Cognaticolwellia beringensis]ASP48796.1 ion transporter [Cognaticolwellia beringensis]|tara:strand:- start:2815 stop:3612 length:798 start_codon:yes stop_codon:yes gene_type:complete
MYQNTKAAFIKLKNNKFFELSVICVIIISALEIGAKTYSLSNTAVSITAVLDTFITLFFLFEISLRFITEEHKKNFFKSAWNVFDTLVVVISLIPINDSEMALLARLVRVFRVLRMISVVPELRILINSLIKALPQLGYVVLLMFIIFYIYAAIGSFMFNTINPKLWGDIAISMLTLFRVMTFEDWTDIQYETMEVYPYSWIYYMTFIFFTAFAFLNMVIGIVVNVMEEEHSKEKNKGQPTLGELKQEITELKSLILKLDEKKNL